MKKRKNKYDNNIKTVKYSELIFQNKISLILNIASKVCKFTGLASSYSILIFFSKIQFFCF